MPHSVLKQQAMKTIPYIIITILVLALLFQNECTPEHKNKIPSQSTTDTIHDTIFQSINHYIPKPIYTDTGSTKWRWHQVDTNQILAEYFACHCYQDTLQNDSNALIVIMDTITQNRITYRQPQITLYPKTIRQTSVVEVSQPIKNKFYLGLAIGRNPNQFSLAPSIMLQSKKGVGYSLSYDIFTKDMYIGIYWQLSFKR
jgi:hypothetical protein